MLVLIFGQTGTMLRWLPSLFGYDIYTVTPGFNGPYITSVLAHAILPVATVVLASIAGFLVAMRNQVITTMDEDFVLMAAAKGLPTRTLISGQILVEIVFNYPGIGYHLNDALGKLDYSLVQGIFVVNTLIVLAANLLADVVYVLIDPRARQIA